MKGIQLLWIAVLAAFGFARAGVESLTVEPAAGACDEEITLRVYGSHPDTCFVVTSIEHLWQSGYPGFVVHVEDHHGDGGGCATVISPYSAEVVLGPIAIGNHFAYAYEEVIPGGGSQDVVWAPFTVSCPPAPGPVLDLRVAKINDGHTLRFTWADVACGQIYRLFGDSVANGTFAAQLGSATSGASGIQIPAFSPSRYFLIGASNACGDGPKH